MIPSLVMLRGDEECGVHKGQLEILSTGDPPKLTLRDLRDLDELRKLSIQDRTAPSPTNKPNASTPTDNCCGDCDRCLWDLILP